MLGQDLGCQPGHLYAVDVDRRSDDKHGRRLASGTILQGLVQLGNSVVAVELFTDEIKEGLFLIAGFAVFPVNSVRRSGQ